MSIEKGPRRIPRANRGHHRNQAKRIRGGDAWRSEVKQQTHAFSRSKGAPGEPWGVPGGTSGAGLVSTGAKKGAKGEPEGGPDLMFV